MRRRNDRSDRDWQTAADRAFLYLRCLDFPAADSFRLAGMALEEAERNILADRSAENPVSETLRVLFALLRGRLRETAAEEDPMGWWCDRKWTGETPGQRESSPGDEIPAATRMSCMPPICRLHMTSEDLKPGSLRALFGKRTGRMKGRGAK